MRALHFQVHIHSTCKYTYTPLVSTRMHIESTRMHVVSTRMHIVRLPCRTSAVLFCDQEFCQEFFSYTKSFFLENAGIITASRAWFRFSLGLGLGSGLGPRDTPRAPGRIR
jgi:hypothetical protein